MTHPDFAAAYLHQSIFGGIAVGSAPITVKLRRGMLVRGKITDRLTGTGVKYAPSGGDRIGSHELVGGYE